MIGTRKFRTKQARIRERKRVAVRVVLLVVLMAVLVMGLLYALTWEGFRVQELVVSTNGALPVGEVTDLAMEHIRASSLLFVPRTSIFLLDIKGLHALLHDTYPRIESVQVRRTGVTAAVIQIRERVPEALWCGDVVPPIAYARASTRAGSADEAWGSCYLLDQNSFIYSRAPVYTGSRYPRYYGSLEKAQPIGQYFIEADEFRRLQHLLELLASSGVETTALLLLDERDMELYLSEGLRVIVARDHAPEVFLRRMTASLEADVIDRSREVEYVDFRFGSKVFIKYRDTLDNNPPITQ